MYIVSGPYNTLLKKYIGLCVIPSSLTKTELMEYLLTAMYKYNVSSITDFVSRGNFDKWDLIPLNAC